MSRPLRIVLLSHNVVDSRGTYFRVQNLGQSMSSAGHLVTLLTTSRSARATLRRRQEHGMTIIESPAIFPGAIRSGWDPYDVLTRTLSVALGHWDGVDVIHAFDCRPTVILPALVLRKRTRARLFIDWADWWGRGGATEERRAGRRLRPIVRPLETFFEERFRTRADHTTVISAALDERARRLGVDPSTITLLPGGANCEAIRPLSSGAARRAAGLEVEGRVVGYLGSAYDRDAKLLVSAFDELRARLPELRLLIVGDLSDNIPDRPGLIRTGKVNDEQLRAFLGSCDLFLLPLADTIANRGRWPGKINLYMAAGRPTIATPVGEVKRIFGMFGGGLLASVDDGQFTVTAEALLNDPERAARIGDQARQVAVESFDWALLAARLVALYRREVEGMPPDLNSEDPLPSAS